MRQYLNALSIKDGTLQLFELQVSEFQFTAYIPDKQVSTVRIVHRAKLPQFTLLLHQFCEAWKHALSPYAEA